MRGVLTGPGGLVGQRVDRAGGGDDRLVHRLLRVRAARQGREQRLVRRPGGRQGGVVGTGRRGHAVADDRAQRGRAVRQYGGGDGERVLVAVVAQPAVAHRGDRAGLLLHVVAFARLGVPAVLAVAVAVHPAGPAGHAHLGLLGGGRLRGHPRVRRLERVLVRLRQTVEAHPVRRDGGGGSGGRRGNGGNRGNRGNRSGGGRRRGCRGRRSGRGWPGGGPGGGPGGLRRVSRRSRSRSSRSRSSRAFRPSRSPRTTRGSRTSRASPASEAEQQGVVRRGRRRGGGGRQVESARTAETVTRLERLLAARAGG